MYLMMASQPEQPTSKQRINMTHGFMKSVIRNQIDRDNYDKEVKAKQQQGKRHSRSSQGKPRKPEIQTYVPPQRFRKESHQLLYTLQYEHKTGDVHTVHVYKADVPEEVARRVGVKFDLPEAFMEALARQIQEEMDKRCI